jgi:hypothetical protein
VADADWNWAQWRFTRSGKLSDKDSGDSIPPNYLVIGISKM